MSAASGRANLLTPEIRTGIYYFTMFMCPAATSAYFSIWLSEKGTLPQDIGFINSAPVFIMLAVNLVIGRIADRAPDWRTVILIGSVASALTPIGLFFVHDFWGILIVWVLVSVPAAAVAPVIDAAAVRLTRRNGSDFASIRAWGTIGFTLVLVATGYVVAWFGPGAFVPFFILISFLRGAAALILPKFRAPESLAPQPVGAVARRASELLKPWLLLPVLAFGLIQTTLFMLHIFAALAWKDSGIPESMIGILLAVGAASEVVVMFVFARFAKRFTARHLILISAVVTALRWAGMAFNPPLAVLVLLQLTHGVSFGFAYLGLVNFIANWTSEDMAAEAQSLALVVQQAITVVGLSLFGVVFGAIGNAAFFGASLLALLAAGATGLSLMLKSSRTESQNGPA